MLCDEVKDRLYEYIYDELEEDKRLKIESHLNKCDNCRRTYEELKGLLIDDMQELTTLKESVVMPEELPQKIRKKLSNNFLSTLPKYAAAACMALILFYTIPVAAYYIVQNSPLEKYIIFDSGIIQEFEQGRAQLVQKSHEMKDITFTVDAIVRKKDTTTVLLTTKVKPTEQINYAMPIGLGRTITLKDQFGNKYNSQGGGATLESVNEDGEVKVIMDFEPIRFWAYKLSINVTGMEIGKMTVEHEKVNGTENKDNVKYDIQKYKNVYGNWKLDFYINRSNKSK
jgi:hypothetical protein